MMTSEEILSLLKERRDHYTKLMNHHAREGNDDLMNSAMGSAFALNAIINKVEPPSEARAKMIKELSDKCIAEHGSIFAEGAKGFWDEVKKLQP